MQDATKTVSNPNVGFVLRSAKTAAAAKALLQLDDEKGLCPFGPSAANNKTAGARNLIFYTDNPERWRQGSSFMHKFEDDEAGLYDLEFFNCREGSHVNFEVGSETGLVFVLLVATKFSLLVLETVCRQPWHL